MADNLKQEIKELLSRITGLGVEEIGDDDDLIEDLGIDSLKVIEIATQVERAYRVIVKDSQLMKLKTVKNAVDFLRELLEQKKNG